MKRSFKNAVDSELNHIRLTPEMLMNIQGEKKVRKKFSIAVVLACTLMLVTFASVALTISDMVQKKM